MKLYLPIDRMESVIGVSCDLISLKRDLFRMNKIWWFQLKVWSKRSYLVHLKVSLEGRSWLRAALRLSPRRSYTT